MESQPQKPEFRNNPENFHPCTQTKNLDLYPRWICQHGRLKVAFAHV